MKNNQDITMVVARYNENLDWLKEVSWNYTVFNKGSQDLPQWIKNQYILPNNGREPHTYLTYIVSFYVNLPEYTAFVQGHPFDHSENIISKIKNFEGDTHFFDLADQTLRGRRHGITHFEQKTMIEAKKIFINDVTDLKYGQGAQFIVKRDAIQSHPKIFYQKILELILEGEAVTEVCPKYDCSCANYYSPWMMERLWRSIFAKRLRTIYD